MATPKNSGRSHVSFPKKKNGRVDRVKIKELYAESPHIEWMPFCKEFGWDENQKSQLVCPDFVLWKRDKKTGVLRARHQALLEKLDEHKDRWSGQVLDALVKLPDMNKLAVQVTHAYWAKVASAIAEEQAKEKSGIKIQEKDRVYKKFKPGDIMALAAATARLTESMQRSLLLDQFSLKRAEEEARMSDEDIEKKADEGSGSKQEQVVFSVMLPDGSKVSDKAIAQHLAAMYDQPQVDQPPIHAEATVVEEGQDGA